MGVQTGLMALAAAGGGSWLGSGDRVGLVANATTVLPDFTHGADAIQGLSGVRLERLFGPEHGVRATAQDMEQVGDSVDAATGVPVVSLYGDTEASLSPTPEQLDGLDALVFDVQDVGARYYTYAATMALCMQVAGKAGVRVVVLDRPNPIGGLAVEGGGIDDPLRNFCGLYAVPQRHGHTVGELAKLYNEHFGVACELTVVPCEGWRRSMYYDETKLPWVLPSPNMPTLDTAIVYPGMCLIEGLDASEGRGTTRPFELVGAPGVDGEVLAQALHDADLPGVRFRACAFTPKFQKHAGAMCGGVQLHVTDRGAFNSYRVGLAVVRELRQRWPNAVGWRTEPYEFRDDVLAIDMLTGWSAVREAVDAGASLAEVVKESERGRDAYEAVRRSALLYS